MPCEQVSCIYFLGFPTELNTTGLFSEGIQCGLIDVYNFIAASFLSFKFCFLIFICLLDTGKHLFY